MCLFGQPVALVRRAGSSQHPLQHVGVPRPQPRRVTGAKRLAEQRLIINDNRRRCGRAGLRRRRGPGATMSVAVPVALFESRRLLLAPERIPIEAQIGMGMLERLAQLFVERLAADANVRRRSKEIQHPRPSRALPGAVRVHHIGRLVAALVAGVADERHGARCSTSGAWRRPSRVWTPFSLVSLFSPRDALVSSPASPASPAWRPSLACLLWSAWRERS